MQKAAFAITFNLVLITAGIGINEEPEELEELEELEEEIYETRTRGHFMPDLINSG